jgi:nitrogen fixation/metabolism regulation signal transduction histidine kinase
VARIPAVRGRQRAVLVGVAVPQDFFVQAERVAAGLQHYRRLGVVVDLQRLYLWLLVAGLVAGLVALALPLATLLARGMARPLTELSAAIGRVARGELSARVEPRGAPELKALGASFNAMTERLAVSRDVSRLLAHEIRNSLTPMRLALHRLLRRLESLPAGERAVAQESLGSLLQEVHDLERLSEEFSHVARLPAPNFERVDLVEVARTAAVLHGPERVRVAIPPGLAMPVWGDRLLLARALHNLFLNAYEASPDGGTVEVRAMRENGEATIEVLDRGEGVPDAVRDRAFEPGVSSKGRGSGLGLSLVRDIASQHRGSATLGDREGGGACARFRVPLMSESEHDAPPQGHAAAKAAR